MMYNKKEDNETMRCPYCVDGVWYYDKNYKPGYGEPYYPPQVPCEVCKGSKAILKKLENCRPDLKRITPSERKQIIQKMREKELKKHGR